MRLRTRALPLLAAAGMFVASCGEDVPEVGDTPVEDDTVEDVAVEGEVDLAVADSPLGEHLVDGDGLTLYLFDDDEPGVSNCTGACLSSWPALTVDDEPTWGDGVDGDLVGMIEREDDGSTQVTYDGMPLYLWAGDSAPGEANGQGIDDVWWVVAPDGRGITEQADDAMEEEGVGGY